MAPVEHNRPAHPWLILAAFAAIYLIWGSTYLAIRWALTGLPPFFMVGTRFVIAGMLLGGWMFLRGERLPTLRQWKNVLVVGTLMLVCGYGTLAWAELYVPSGMAALICALTPMAMAGLNAVMPGPGGLPPGRPPIRVVVGLVVGIVGMLLLIRGQDGTFGGLGPGLMPKVAGLALAVSTLTWALGSLLSCRLALPGSVFVSTAAQMLAGGTVLLGVSAFNGELSEVSLSQLTWSAGLSHAYLIVFGSIVALTAYVWLLKVVSPAQVATHAYVNPVVALVLGWALGGETLTAPTGLAAAVMVSGVAMIVTAGDAKAAAAPSPPSRVSLMEGSLSRNLTCADPPAARGGGHTPHAERDPS